MSFRKVTHIIFDLDGLLIESESIYDRIIQNIVSQFGKTPTNDLRIKLLGRTDQDTATIVVKDLELPISTETFLAMYQKQTYEEFDHPSLMPGALELIRYFSDNNIPMAVATSSSLQSMELKTRHLIDTFRLFNHIVCGSTDLEVKRGKPAPDIFQVCARRFPNRADPSKCLVFEDSPHGIQGALAAGMQGILVPQDYVSEELRKPATLVLRSLKDFVPELFDLPKKSF